MPNAGPPHVIAGQIPVLARMVARLLRRAIHFALDVLPFAAANRLLACVAILLLPVLTGVPRSVTGKFAFTAVPRSVILAAACAASLADLALTTVFVTLWVSCFLPSSVKISWKTSTNLLHARWAVSAISRKTKSSTKHLKCKLLGGG